MKRCFVSVGPWGLSVPKVATIFSARLRAGICTSVNSAGIRPLLPAELSLLLQNSHLPSGFLVSTLSPSQKVLYPPSVSLENSAYLPMRPSAWSTISNFHHSTHFACEHAQDASSNRVVWTAYVHCCGITFWLEDYRLRCFCLSPSISPGLRWLLLRARPKPVKLTVRQPS